MGLAFPLAALIAAFVLISASGSSDSNYFESRMSVTFDGRLDIPTPSESVTKIQAVSSQADGDFLGNDVAQIAFQFTAPFATEISEDGRTITFLARDRSDSTTESFVAAAARRFVADRPELALYSTPTTTVQLAGIEAAGLKIGHSAIGLLLIAVLAIFAAATRPTALPARISSREDRESVSKDDLRL
jgi:hypothetical protein